MEARKAAESKDRPGGRNERNVLFRGSVIPSKKSSIKVMSIHTMITILQSSVWLGIGSKGKGKLDVQFLIRRVLQSWCRCY